MDEYTYKNGGRTIAQTPAPKKERIYGSEKNKPESSKDTKSAEKIEFNEKTLETIKNKVAEHNENNPNKKVTLASAKAVVRRGMGAYSSTHRPTIKGGKPNSRVAWGLARLNAFLYKVVKGKSKSGKYSQDNDLLDELGIKHQKFENGGLIAPNGKQSNLTPEQYKLVRTPEFKAWFGDWENDPENASKVVDVNGEPLVVYHGSKNTFEKFDIKKKGSNTGINNSDIIFFASNIETAKSPLYVNYKSDKKILDKFIEDIKKTHYDNFEKISKIFNVDKNKLREKFIKYFSDKELLNLDQYINDYITDTIEFNEGRITKSDYIKAKNAINLIGMDERNVMAVLEEEFDIEYSEEKENQVFELIQKNIDFYLKRLDNDIKLDENSKIYKAFLNIRKPEIIDEFEEGESIQSISEQKSNKDGNIFIDTRDGGRERSNIYSVYDESQIKTVEQSLKETPRAGSVVGGEVKLQYNNNGEHLAPNGKPSNLTHEQWHLVRTPKFKAWFGDWENNPENSSKVVDENGEPLIVFHRSKKAFYLFDTEKQLNGWLGKGFYFSESKDEFKNYGNKLLSVFLNIKNPFKVKGESPTDFLYELKNIIDTDENNTTQNLKNNYYDGVIYKHWDYEGRMFTCFESEQIKLSDGTNTTFDGINPDIRYAGGGMIGKSRSMIRNVRGGWTKDKILRYLKEYDSDTISTYTLTKFISELNNWKELKSLLYYHGTTNYIERGLKPSIVFSEKVAESIGGGGYGQRYWGISLTKRKRTAESFSGMSRSVIIYPVFLKKDAVVIERTDISDSSEVEDIIVELYEKGIDAVWIGGGEEELVVVNPRSIMIYKKGSDSYNVYGGFKSKNLTDEEIENIYQNCKSKWSEYYKKYTESDKDNRELFIKSLEPIKFIDGGSVLLAPNGKQSNLTPEKYKLVRTPEFKAWFGDWENDTANASKIIDENGEPKVMYSGSPNKFTIFKTDLIEVDRDDREYKSRFWFIANKENAEDYSRKATGNISSVYEVFLNIRNPKYDFNLYVEDNQDGSVEFRNKKIWVAIATYSNQIKLADCTNNTFDGSNPDIRYASGGSLTDVNVSYANEQQVNELYDLVSKSNELGNVGHPRLVLIQNNKVIGGIFVDNDYLPYEYMFDIFIKKSKRGKGYSKLLLDAMIKDFVENFPKADQIRGWVINRKLQDYLQSKYDFGCADDNEEQILYCYLSKKDAEKLLNNANNRGKILPKNNLKRFIIKENSDSQNYQKAIKFAIDNDYILKSDISYNGYIFIEKLLKDGDDKIEIQIYDGIKKDKAPKVEVLSKVANFGNILDETKYRFAYMGFHKKWDDDWRDIKNLEQAFKYAIKLEKNINKDNEQNTMKFNKKTDDVIDSKKNVLAIAKEMGEGVNRVKIIEVPVEMINTDVSRFQNRKTEYSQKTVDSIVNDVKDNNFNWGIFDAILLWYNTNDNKLYVLIGHSRTQAFKQLSSMGYEDFKTIPAKIITTDSIKKAEEIAIDSNVKADREQVTERVKRYRKLLKDGMPYYKVKELATKNEGRGSASNFMALSYLNPKGKIINLLSKYESGETSKNTENIQTISKYVGEARSKFSQLTDSHEDELFDWLVFSGALNKIKRESEFLDRVGNIISRFDFNPNEPLNIAQKETKTNYDVEYEKKEKELIDEIEKKRDLIDSKVERYIKANIVPEKIAELLDKDEAELSVLRKKLIQHQTKGKEQVIQANKQTLSLFDDIPIADTVKSFKNDFNTKLTDSELNEWRNLAELSDYMLTQEFKTKKEYNEWINLAELSKMMIK